MVPLLAKTQLAAVALKWRLALATPMLLGDPSGQLAADRAMMGDRVVSAIPHDELATLLREHPEKFGSISVGKPSRGALLNGVVPKEGPNIRLMAKDHAFGTEETVNSLERIATRMQELFPQSTPLVIGHISDHDGGKLRPHLSHQSGRDVDVGFYYTDKPTWYRRATAQNLDVARTWALVRALITESDVEMIFVDRGIQALLHDYAKTHEADQDWVELVFKGKDAELPTLRHARGHATHLHVRFYSPKAQRLGVELYPLLVEQELVPKSDTFQTYVAQKGDSLEKISKKFGITIKQFKTINGMKGNTIIAKQSYRLPGSRGVSVEAAPLVIPARRLPKVVSVSPATGSATPAPSSNTPSPAPQQEKQAKSVATAAKSPSPKPKSGGRKTSSK